VSAKLFTKAHEEEKEPSPTAEASADEALESPVSKGDAFEEKEADAFMQKSMSDIAQVIPGLDIETGSQQVPITAQEPPAPTSEEHRASLDAIIDYFKCVSDMYGASSEGASGAQGCVPREQLTLEIAHGLLAGIEWFYDMGIHKINAYLNSDENEIRRLSEAFLSSITSLRMALHGAPRVNYVLVGEPHDANDTFTQNSVRYADTYYSDLPEGGVVVKDYSIAGVADLFNAVESECPERMIGRIDIFAHGIINTYESENGIVEKEENALRFGQDEVTLAEMEAEAQGRQFTGKYLSNMTRFDRDTVIELHACRTASGEGPSFLEGMGRALGGNRGQTVIGYEQRWAPRPFVMSWQYTESNGTFHSRAVRNTATDVYGPNALPDRNGCEEDHGPFIERWEENAVQLFDVAVQGGFEVQKYLTVEELGGFEPSRERKISIINAMYDENQALVLGFMYSTPTTPPENIDPLQMVERPSETLTSEPDWETLVLHPSVESEDDIF